MENCWRGCDNGRPHGDRRSLGYLTDNYPALDARSDRGRSHRVSGRTARRGAREPQRAHDSVRELRAPVRDRIGEGHTSAYQEADGHGRVDVTARERADRVDEDEQHEAKPERCSEHARGDAPSVQLEAEAECGHPAPMNTSTAVPRNSAAHLRAIGSAPNLVPAGAPTGPGPAWRAYYRTRLAAGQLEPARRSALGNAWRRPSELG